MPTTRPRSSLRLKKPTPKAAALNTPPKAKAPSPTITPSKRQPNSHAASATPNKKPRRGLQHFQLKRKSDKKKPRVARELLEPELEPEPEPELEPEDEKASESESSGDEQEETDDEDDKKADDGQRTDGDNADETDPEAADESEDSDDDEESDESVIEVVNKVQPKSKAQKYAQRPERKQREQTFLEFMATLSEDESDGDTSDSDAELAEQVEAPEVDAEQGPTIISLSIDVYTSRVTGLANSTVVIDQKRSDANQRFIIDARNIIGVTKWNRGTMSYDTIHYLKVNDLLVGVELRDKNTRISYEAYGVPQRRLVTEFDNDMAKLLKELNKRFSEFGYQFESNSDAPLLLFNFIKGDDNSNYLHGHTFFLGESILNELGSSVTHNGKRMYRLHPKTKLKDAARKLDQYIRNNGIRATEIKVKNQTFHPIF